MLPYMPLCKNSLSLIVLQKFFLAIFFQITKILKANSTEGLAFII
jgi:hypothetical protein